MPTREVPRSDWSRDFEEFSRTRQGEQVTVELIFDPQSDPQFPFHRQPLIGIRYEDTDGEDSAIQIVTGPAAASATHIISHPVHVYHKNAAGLISDEVNEDEILEFTSTDDPRITFLRFHRPA